VNHGTELRHADAPLTGDLKAPGIAPAEAKRQAVETLRLHQPADEEKPPRTERVLSPSGGR
jgi:hypothetical protein